MRSKIFSLLAAAGTCLLLAACATYSQYPLTYQIPIEPTVISSDYGPPNLAVNGVQDVPVHPGAPLYYQVVSPVNVVFYAFDKIGPGPGGPILGQFQGTNFASSVLPTGHTVEFVFSATQPVAGGSVQLTVSSNPPSAGSAANPYPQAAAPAPQPLVSISPLNTTTAVGQPVTFSASGGAGTGDFVWGGAAPASGWSNMYTFNAPGTYTITVYRSADASYTQSNTAAATVNITPAPVQATTPYPANPLPPVTVTPVH
jgi:hypothetical protein